MASRSLSCPLRFGSLDCLCHPPGTSRHLLPSNDDAATLVCIDRSEVHHPDHADPMLLELTVRLQPVAAPCRDFDPMFAEADVAGRAPRVEVGHAHVGRLELASFTEPPGAVPEEVVATPAAECIAQTLAELEPVRFDVQGSPLVLRIMTAELRNVTVARGTRQTLPLHLFANEENTENESAANFANAVCRAAPTPVLHTSPPAVLRGCSNRNSLSGAARGSQGSRATVPRSPPFRRKTL